MVTEQKVKRGLEECLDDFQGPVYNFGRIKMARQMIIIQFFVELNCSSKLAIESFENHLEC